MDIIDEVKQELSEENVHRLIKKYSPLIFGMMVAIIIGITAGLWWKSYRADKIHQDGGQYLKAILEMKTYKPDEAIKTFETIANNNTTYGVFAGLNIGAFKYFKKDYAESQKWYSGISDNSSNEQSFRELAELMKIKAMIANDANAELSIKALETYIKHNPTYKNSAEELLAMLYIQNNKPEKANEVLNLLVTDTTAPNTIKERAEQLLALVKK